MFTDLAWTYFTEGEEEHLEDEERRLNQQACPKRLLVQLRREKPRAARVTCERSMEASTVSPASSARGTSRAQPRHHQC